jgi:arogenate dehydrogenase (NADP+)
MKIGIVGLGLIGGSLGLDLRRQGHWVAGVSRRSTTCDRALALGVVDAASPDLAPMTEAEVVFLCPPLDQILPTAQALLPHLQPGAILTDVGSAKAHIVAQLEPLWPEFVGGHPMAGKAESGLEVAQGGLFAGNPYVLTPTERSAPGAIATLTSLIHSLQARFYSCSPADHDLAVAWISHLPVMVSASLLGAWSLEPDAAVQNLAQNLASSGFRDTSRVGGGVPELGVLMAQYNRSALLHSLDHYQQTLQQVRTWIETENWAALEAFLRQTQSDRAQFNLT